MNKPSLKQKTDKELSHSSRVASLILEYLEMSSKPLKMGELMKKTGLSLRSIRYGLRILLNSNKVTKLADLQDLRSSYYQVKS